MRKLKIVAIFFVMLLFAGCMKSKTEVTVNSNGSVDVAYTTAMSKKVIEDLGNSGGEGSSNTETLSEDDKKKLEEKGYSIENYDDGDYTGFKVIKHYNSIDEISTTEDVEISTNLVEDENTKLFTVKKGFFANTYKTKITANKEKGSLEQIKTYQTDEYADYFKGLELSYNITLPSKATSNNATSVNGNTYTWDLTTFDKDTIEYEFTLLNITNIAIVCVGAALIIGGIAFIVIKKKTK